MKCPQCIKNGMKSRIHTKGGSKTLIGHRPYYDEEGVYHNHDPNITRQYFRCTNGHKWIERRQGKCPAEDCDFGGLISREMI